MTPEQKADRAKAIDACIDILGQYLTDYLTDTDDPDGLVDGRVEGFEHVDPDIDDIRSQLQDLEDE